MLNSTAISREFQPSYSFSWYMSKLFILIIAGAYITSKMRGENVPGLIEILGIGALFMVAYSVAFTLRAVEFGAKIKLRYLLWPAKVFDYKEILEVRLPEIVLSSRKPIKFENIINLEELQQEFKSLELMSVIPRGRIKEFRAPASNFSFRPKLSNIIWALVTVFVLGYDLFEISQAVNLLWAAIMAIFFISEIFSGLFRKPKDE